jgi:predicted RNase H-related nuclease YkuK (DUF458 family)
MERFLKGYFFNPTKGNLKLTEVVSEILEYKEEKPQEKYEIIVGCDSSSKEEPCFPVAVVVLRAKQGGRFFLKKVKYTNRKFFSWRQRILEEVFLSIQLATFLREQFEKIEKQSKRELNCQIRYIHADIGNNGPTKEMIREVIGLIRGNGFEPKIKPESYVATIVADRYS